MTLEAVKGFLGDLRWMSLRQARRIAELADRHDLRRFLELGFMHGVSTCYLAAIASDQGGNVTACDLPSSAELSPPLEQLLERCGLRELVQIHRDSEGAEWRMMELLEQGAMFDFAYIDAAHTWQCAGFSFFLAEKLLRPGGWIIFDDLDYLLIEQPYEDQPLARRLTKEQRETPQVRKVWELLAKPHPYFGEFLESESWGWCRKIGGVQPACRRADTNFPVVPLGVDVFAKCRK